MSSLLNNASLLLNPAGSIISYQEDKIYSVLPRDGTGDFTFSGGDGGTRVNQQGYIEVTPANLIINSETIGASPWILNDTVITANSTVAPNGTTTADTVANNGTNATHRVYQGPFTGYASPQTMSFSLYVKYNNHQYFSFGLTDDSVYRSQVVVDLTNGTITQNFVNTGGDTLTSTITNVGGGWYYVTGTLTYATSLAGGNLYFLCTLQNQSTFSAGGYVGTGTSVFVWGAMFNTGGVKPYQPTTDRLNYPRITYQNGRGALLSEPQRTNLWVQSQTFTAYGLYRLTLTQNAGISPDGTSNAVRWVDTATTGNHQLEPSFTATSGQSYTISVFVKAAERTQFHIFAFADNGVFNNTDAFYDVAAGTVISGTGASIEKWPNGWYRCIRTMTAGASGTGYWGVGPAVNGAASYTGDTNSGILVWGGQNEASSFPTSYIPTTSATVTRPADIASNTNASSLIGQSAGAVYFDFTLDNLYSNAQTNQPVLWYMKDGGAGERYVELINGNLLYYVEYDGSTVIANISSPAINAGRHKCAIAYANNDMVFYVDGVQVGIDGSGTPNGYSTVSTQYYNSFYYGQCKVHSLAPYTTRLTNTQLQELTTVRSGSGGNISYYGPYTVHTFTGSATFTPSFNGEVEVLVVAGGGGTGYDVGGGGGGGGVIYVSSYGVTANSGVTVTIGAGGTSGQTHSVPGGNGGNSVFGGLTALGGGGGGTYPSGQVNGLDGGSGGGAGNQSAVGGSGSIGQGFNGGSSSAPWGSGGGGGAAGNGANAIQNQTVPGGLGATYSISGFSNTYSGGGYGAYDSQPNLQTGQSASGAFLGYYGYGANGTGLPNNSSYIGNPGIVILRYLT